MSKFWASQILKTIRRRGQARYPCCFGFGPGRLKPGRRRNLLAPNNILVLLVESSTFAMGQGSSSSLKPPAPGVALCWRLTCDLGPRAWLSAVGGWAGAVPRTQGPRPCPSGIRWSALVLKQGICEKYFALTPRLKPMKVTTSHLPEKKRPCLPCPDSPLLYRGYACVVGHPCGHHSELPAPCSLLFLPAPCYSQRGASQGEYRAISKMGGV